MTPVEPPLHDNARLVVYAKDQPEYIPLPASLSPDGLMLTEWEPDETELMALMQGGRVRLWVHTFNQPLQPVRLEVVPPDCGLRDS